MSRIVRAARSIGFDPSDDAELKTRQELLVKFTLLVAPAGLAWGALYFAFGETAAAIVPLAYVPLSLVNLATFGLTRAYRRHVAVQLALMLLLPFLLQLTLGGYRASSAVVMWSVIAPFAALVLSGPRGGIPWAVAFVGIAAAAALLDPLVARPSHLSNGLVTLMFAANIGAIFVIAFSLLATFLTQKDSAMRLLARERERSESLLLNVLPKEIAPRLKAGESPLADAYDAATIIFADMVGFTSLTASLPPREMVGLLNEIVSEFDRLADRHGVEKIRTIGDSYMAVAGVPEPRQDHAAAIARMALDMRGFLDELPLRGEHRIDFRMGIESGPCVGGVIGVRKFVFDIWGDPVNTASRMESHGVPGRIQVGEAAYELLKDDFKLEPRGTIDVKGKGPMRTWFLVGERASGTRPVAAVAREPPSVEAG